MKLGRLISRIAANANTRSPRNVKKAINVNQPRSVKVTKR